MNENQRFVYQDKLYLRIGPEVVEGRVQTLDERMQTPEVRRDFERLWSLRDASLCPYCGVTLADPLAKIEGKGRVYPYYTTLKECPNCGWWALSHMHVEYTQELREEEFGVWEYYEAVLGTFDLGSRMVALDTLKNHLRRKFDDVRHIYPRKFEELCASVFREYMNCEVKHTAASQDGGIDLYAITSDTGVYAVQCKRREKPIAESVEQVRAFLGAMIVAGMPRGIVVTTADHFSPQALSLANAPPLKNLGIELQLIDFEQFRQLFNLTVAVSDRPWREFVASEYRV